MQGTSLPKNEDNTAYCTYKVSNWADKDCHNEEERFILHTRSLPEILSQKMNKQSIDKIMQDHACEDAYR